MVAGLQHDASLSKLKLLELERAVRLLTSLITQTFPFYFPFPERRSRKIPFQSVRLGGELRKKEKPLPSLYSFSDI